MNSKVLVLPSFAKINLFLKVLGKRPHDNYHELCTIFQTISLKDEIFFEENNKILLTCSSSNIPTDEKNLIIKAAELLREKYRINKGARIHLEKKTPAPGGLGGGSSNAAMALLGLSSLWELDVKSDDLLALGKLIGADVPFFFYGGTMLGKGRGTELSNLKDIEENYLLVITPNIEISTAEAYAKLSAPYLTKKDDKSILTICRNLIGNQFPADLQLENDFENSVFSSEPKIKELKEQILDLGATNALMSGSGASVFGIFDNEKKQRFAFEAFDKKDLKRFAVKTISRQEYIKFLEPCKHLIPKSL